MFNSYKTPPELIVAPIISYIEISFHQVVVLYFFTLYVVECVFLLVDKKSALYFKNHNNNCKCNFTHIKYFYYLLATNP